MMNFIAWIILGILAGAIAKLLFRLIELICPGLHPRRH